MSMSKAELVQQAFNALNNFKRHRALAELYPSERQLHELQMYKMIDHLELALRAINKEVREELNTSCGKSSQE